MVGYKVGTDVVITIATWSELGKWIVARDARLKALEDCLKVKP